MKEQLKPSIDQALASLGLFVDDAYFEKEEGINYLRIILDSEEIVDLNTIVEATKIINPLIDEMDLKEEDYILDIFSKEKGEVE